MTEISFYTHAAEPLVTAAKIARKAYSQGHAVRILTQNFSETEALDKSLWALAPTDFLPHCRLADAEASVTAIIVDHLHEHQGASDVLIHWGDNIPTFFSRFLRVVEIVGRDEIAVASGRERWAHYKARGYALKHHKLPDE